MRFRSFYVAACVVFCAFLLSGCAGGGSAAARLPSVPTAGAGHAAVGNAATRRTLGVATCSGTGTGSVVAGGESNVAAGVAAGVLGGESNQACDDESIVVGGFENAVSSSDQSVQAFVGAGSYNVITGNDAEAAIVAGEQNTVEGTANDALIGAGISNTIEGTSNQAFVGSGYGNAINGGNYGVIAGGAHNTASNTAASVVGGAHNANGGYYATIAGGVSNTISSAGEGAYVGAGGYNNVSGEGAVIDGGFNSSASGTFATIPGGYVNSAAGTYSFAAGARASAAQTGSFVWSDGSDGDAILTSSRAYQFLARASGGFTLYTNAASTVGAQLAAGSGTWASLSDRNAKTAIVPLDDDAVLAKIDGLPISRWSYKSEHGVRHAGPMAQDFYAAFKLGEDDRHITSIDEDGVALAAIKALHAENARLRTRLGRVDSELASLRAAVERLQAR